MVKGDFKGLEDLRRRFAALSTPVARVGLAKALAEEARHQVQEGFRASRDPYGRPWKPLASRSGQPLRDTGRLMGSLTSKTATVATERGFTVSTDVKYAAVHQYGATIVAKNAPYLRFRVGGARPRSGGQWVSKKQVTVPRRQFMPEDTVPQGWVSAFNDQATSYMRRLMGRA
jgi:phage virion morphogenesis protein